MIALHSFLTLKKSTKTSVVQSNELHPIQSQYNTYLIKTLYALGHNLQPLYGFWTISNKMAISQFQLNAFQEKRMSGRVGLVAVHHV